MSASSVANSARQAAQSLQESIDQVPSQLTAISSNIDGLQRRAASDSVAITETNTTVTAVRDEATTVERRVTDVTSLLDQLMAEVNSSRLLTPERITGVNDTLTRMLTQVEALEVTIETTLEQVNILEEQTQQLRNRYTELLHHRDLLLELQETISQLEECGCFIDQSCGIGHFLFLSLSFTGSHVGCTLCLSDHFQETLKVIMEPHYLIQPLS